MVFFIKLYYRYYSKLTILSAFLYILSKFGRSFSLHYYSPSKTINTESELICYLQKLNNTYFSRKNVKDFTKQDKNDFFLKKKTYLCAQRALPPSTSAIEASFIALGLASVVRQMSAKRTLKTTKSRKNEQIQIPD